MAPDLEPNSDAKILQIFCNPLLQTNLTRLESTLSSENQTFLFSSSLFIFLSLSSLFNSFSFIFESEKLRGSQKCILGPLEVFKKFMVVGGGWVGGGWWRDDHTVSKVKSFSLLTFS